MMSQALELPANLLRLGGLAFAAIGFLVVYLVRS